MMPKSPVCFGLLLGLVTATASQAQSVERLDLVCSVESRYAYTDPDRRGGVERVEHRFRIDLASRQFCADQCHVLFNLPENTTSELDLTHRPMLSDGTPHEVDLSVTVNRLTGRVMTESRSERLTTHGMGQCQRELFSGFPAPMF